MCSCAKGQKEQTVVKRVLDGGGSTVSRSTRCGEIRLVYLALHHGLFQS